jgi:hypothetical protein
VLVPKKTGTERRRVTVDPNEEPLGPYRTSPALYVGLLDPRRQEALPWPRSRDYHNIETIGSWPLWSQRIWPI